MSRSNADRSPCTAKEELRDLLRKIEVTPFTPEKSTTFAYSRNIAAYGALSQEQKVRLEALFGEEEETARTLFEHFQSRWLDPNVPLHPAEEDIAGYQADQAALDSSEVHNTVYRGLANVHLDRLARNVDSLAYINIPLPSPPNSLGSVTIPRHARSILDEFFRVFGTPNRAEAQMLSRAFGIREGDLDILCK